MTLAEPREAAPRTVVLVRTLAAPAARVHAAFTTPADLLRWMAPPPYRVVEAVAEPRPGGAYRVRVVGPDGDEHLTAGEFLEVVPDRRLVQSWRYEGAFGRDAAPTRVTVELRPLGDAATELTLTHAGIPAAPHYARVEHGWAECLTALAAVVEEGYVHVRVARRLAAPPARVFDAWLDPAVIGAWMGSTGEMVGVEVDARLGGTFRFVVRRDGEDVVHVGEYVEFDRPRRLAFTWVLPQFSADGDVVRLDLAPADGGCALTLVHRMRADWAAYGERAAGAWNAMLDAVAAMVA